MIVACAEPEIAAAVAAHGGTAVLTDPDLPSGTDRIFQALGRIDAERRFARVINLQGDLPTLDPAAIRTALEPLDRLGMEARAGNLINGADRVETAARAGKVHLLLHAADAGDDGRRRLDQAWRVGGGGPQGLVFPEGRTILSMALGRENVVHAALTDPAAARRVSHAIDRWLAFIDPDAGLEGGSAAIGAGTADDLNEGTE